MSSLAFVLAAVPIARAGQRRHRPTWTAVALAAAFEGLGSVAYHGPGGRWSKGWHDVGLVGLAITIGAAVRSDGTPVDRRPLTAALTTAAITLHTLSRTGGPLCASERRLQGHALFHVLAAAALVTAAQAR